MTKTYTKNGIEYGFQISNRKWVFKTPSFTFLAACNGVERAHKVASFVAGALKRTSGTGLDGMARANINKLVGI